MLADLVKAGKLPPVVERLPKEPRSCRWSKRSAHYGGTWRRPGAIDIDGRWPTRARSAWPSSAWMAASSSPTPSSGRSRTTARPLPSSIREGHQVVRWQALHRRRCRVCAGRRVAEQRAAPHRSGLAQLWRRQWCTGKGGHSPFLSSSLKALRPLLQILSQHTPGILLRT